MFSHIFSDWIFLCVNKQNSSTDLDQGKLTLGVKTPSNSLPRWIKVRTILPWLIQTLNFLCLWFILFLDYQSSPCEFTFSSKIRRNLLLSKTWGNKPKA